MKQKIILALIAMFPIISATAQFKKGDVYVGANLNTNLDTRTTNTAPKDKNWLRTLQLQVEGGKAIRNNLVLGTRIGFGTVPGNTFVTDGLKNGYGSNPYFSADLFARKYVSLGSRFSLYGELALTGTRGRYFSSGTDLSGLKYETTMKSQSIMLGGSIGVSLKISNSVSLEFGMNNLLSTRYSRTSGTKTYTTTNNTIPLSATQFESNPFNGLGRNISLGIKFRLHK